jgi:hypothetical protein
VVVVVGGGCWWLLLVVGGGSGGWWLLVVMVCVCVERGNALGRLSLLLGINVVSFAVEIIEAQHLGHHQNHLNVEGLHRYEESKMEQIRIAEHKITVERVSSRLSSSQHKLFMFRS